jgi:hypothetical protein
VAQGGFEVTRTRLCADQPNFRFMLNRHTHLKG